MPTEVDQMYMKARRISRPKELNFLLGSPLKAREEARPSRLCAGWSRHLAAHHNVSQARNAKPTCTSLGMDPVDFQGVHRRFHEISHPVEEEQWKDVGTDVMSSVLEACSCM